jgi:uncharacterized protein YjiS (DUF1127 family)
MLFANLFAAAKHAITRWYRRRMAFEELMSLSDRSLADIGICRSQIHSVVYGQTEAEVELPVERPVMSVRGSAKEVVACGD